VRSVTSRGLHRVTHVRLSIPTVKLDTPPGSPLFRVVTSMAFANLEQSTAVGCVISEKRQQPFGNGMAEID
jgi:hypothetical protein